jgi:hypothetical protein
MVFKCIKQQLAERDTLAIDLRKKVEALNIAIVAFNQATSGNASDAHAELR